MEPFSSPIATLDLMCIPTSETVLVDASLSRKIDSLNRHKATKSYNSLGFR